MGAEQAGQVVGYLRTLGHTADIEITKGNPERGKAIYESSGCASCHIINGQRVGGGAGADTRRLYARA